MFRDGMKMSGKEGQEELKEVAAELDNKGKEGEDKLMESGGVAGKETIGERVRRLVGRVLSPVWVEGFVLTFLAEWGDRSQIASRWSFLKWILVWTEF